MVVASVAPALGSRGQATFIVPSARPGLSMGQKSGKHGIRASRTAEVILNDVRVPSRCLVGGKERLDRIREGGRGGGQAAMKTFETARPSVAAKVGVAGGRADPGAGRAADRAEPGGHVPVGRHGRCGRCARC